MALFVGIQVAAFFTTVTTKFTTATTKFSLPADVPEPEFNDDVNEFPNSPIGIHVSYIGVNESTLRFLIYNGSREKLSCYGYSGLCLSPEIRINGLDGSAWMCMNGTSVYEIMPGDTVEMMVSPDDFARVPGKNDKVSVGFKSITNDTQGYDFAEPIILPPAFRNKIRESFLKRDE